MVALSLGALVIRAGTTPQSNSLGGIYASILVVGQLWVKQDVWVISNQREAHAAQHKALCWRHRPATVHKPRQHMTKKVKTYLICTLNMQCPEVHCTA